MDSTYKYVPSSPHYLYPKSSLMLSNKSGVKLLGKMGRYVYSIMVAGVLYVPSYPYFFRSWLC